METESVFMNMGIVLACEKKMLMCFITLNLKCILF